MLKIMNRLETLRSCEHTLEGKESLITVRDLLKWGNWIGKNNTKLNLAIEGSNLLA